MYNDARYVLFYLFDADIPLLMTSREQNERKFGNWEALLTGGRRYWFEVTGHHGWRARYVKEVDGSEATVRF